MRIGLLGGSFNPAHEGHLHISLEARKRLKLHQVWWLVSPQNPLKPSAGMAAFSERMLQAESISGHHSFIKVTDLEQQWGTRYTIDTINKLQQAFPGFKFVWLMGADNLQQIPRWKRWREIFKSIPIAVLDRVPFNYQALQGQAALYFRQARLQESQSSMLVEQVPPAWAYLHIVPHEASSTAIRAARRTTP